MYRLGASYIDSGASREADYDFRNSFLNPTTPAVVTQNSDTDQVLGGSIYDPAYYSSLFSQDNGYSYGVCIMSSFIYQKFSFYKLNIPSSSFEWFSCQTFRHLLESNIIVYDLFIFKFSVNTDLLEPICFSNTYIWEQSTVGNNAEKEISDSTERLTKLYVYKL